MTLYLIIALVFWYYVSRLLVAACVLSADLLLQPGIPI